MENVLELIKPMYEAFNNEVPQYNKIWGYHTGDTDAKKNYTKTRRSNLKVGCNYLKKFVKEETSYSVGNKITFTSKSENQKAVDVINLLSENFNENHDINTFLNMVFILFITPYRYFSFQEFNNSVGKYG